MGEARMMSDLAQLGRDSFGQQPWRCRLEWGHRGAAAAVVRGDVVVVVDTLTFSTAVATALHGGVTVYPCRPSDKEPLAKEVVAEAAVRRQDVPQKGRFSLSPATFLAADPGARVVLDSPNGAACCVIARAAPCEVVGSFVNAQAVAHFVSARLAEGDRAVTVLACGERWLTPVEGEDLRFAVEDWLGAGAILALLNLDKSPEAQVCEAAFRGVRHRLEEILLNCGSGVELCEKGYKGDVLHAARLDLYGTVPLLSEGRFVNAAGPARQEETGRVNQ
jgi:2-phosphosulfolactate phosphatase